MNHGAIGLVIKNKMTLMGLLLLFFLVSCGGSDSSSTPSGQIAGDIGQSQEQGNAQAEEQREELKLHFHVEHRYRWIPEYTKEIYRYLDRPELSALLMTELSNRDLKFLKCEGYETASISERKRFWATFIASIAHAESGLNPMTTYREKDGTLSSGLLQIDLASANRHSRSYTGYTFTQRDLFNPALNLMAGLYVMKHQLEGGIFYERPEIKGRLFTERSYYWSVLTLKRELILKTFNKNALENLKFCL